MAVRYLLISVVLAQFPAGAQTSSLVPSFAVTALPAPCAAGGSATNVISGDFNGDHKPDIAIFCNSATEVSVLLGNGDGTFQAPLMTSAPGPSGAVLALDVNGDGRTDIIFNASGPVLMTSNAEGPSTNLILMLAGPDGTLGAPTILAKSLPYTAEAAADVNGDGIPDLLLDGGTGFNLFSVGPAIMLGKPDGTFSSPAPLTLPTGAKLSQIALTADFNHDGKTDIAIWYLQLETDISNDQLHVWVLLNQGQGSFGAPIPVLSETSDLTNPQFVAGDFTGTGNMDIAAAINQTIGQFTLVTYLFVALGNGEGTFQLVQPAPQITGNYVVALDLNGDGKLDLVTGFGNLLTPYLSNGDGTFQKLTPINLGVSFDPTVVADFNGDGKPDMADPASVAINTTSAPAVTAALNGASFTTGEPLAGGSLVSIFGADFAMSSAGAPAIPLKSDLGGVSVTIGGFPAPLLFVGSTQINLQVPWEVTGSTADVVVTTASGTALPPFHASVGPVSPGIFTFQSGTGQAIATDFETGALAGSTGSISGVALQPAKVGDILVILATGLGAVSPADTDGENSLDATRNTTVKPVVLIGGVPAGFLFSGLSPQFVGVYQINVTIPKVPAGVVPLQLNMGGITTSDQVTIAVENP